ncbi:hypothetical protein A9X06_03210 [Mycobacterium sp. 852002-51759_SCH5129042]|nr:hypothetical protein A9X06_03210 [Mycobacterium sp. 852002-51759_SCH5129042]
MGDDGPDNGQRTDSERIQQLETEIRRLNRIIADLQPLADRVATIERKLRDREFQERSISAQMRGR